MTEHECYMKDKIEEISDKVDKVGDNVDKVLVTLKGDEFGNIGVIPTQNAHEKRLELLEEMQLINKIQVGTVVKIAYTIGIGLGIIIPLVEFVISKLFK